MRAIVRECEVRELQLDEALELDWRYVKREA